MSQLFTLNAARRTETGTTACRRLRRQGLIPANVYGHEIDPVSVKLSGDDLRPVISSGAHVVDLNIDGQIEKALIRDVQWDTFSTDVQHVDLLRVDPNERVHVLVPVHLKGTAPGALANGMLEHHLHSLNVECPAVEIPDEIGVRINQLQIGDAIHVSDLQDLPEHLTVLDPPDTVIVQITEAVVAAPVEVEAVEGIAEPELIGRAAAEAEESA
jgi:large subunit ribosomal protein L25